MKVPARSKKKSGSVQRGGGAHFDFFSIDRMLAVLSIVMVVVVLFLVATFTPVQSTGRPIGIALPAPSSLPSSYSFIVATTPFASDPSGQNPVESGLVTAFDGKGNTLWQRFGGRAYQYMGYSIDVGGDPNRDGVPDVIVGSPWSNGTSGRIDLLSGKSGSIICNAILTPQSPNTFLGASVSAAGNLNGDSFPDYIAGAPKADETTTGTNAGQAYGISGADCSFPIVSTGRTLNDHFGKTVLINTGLFIDSDSVNDYVVQAVELSTATPRNGKLYAYSGSSGTLLWSVSGEPNEAYFGARMSIVGDVDGDGTLDIITGGPGSIFPGTTGLRNPGYATIVSGKTGSKIVRIPGENNGDMFGFSVSGLGDNDRDGKFEFSVTAPSYSGGGISNQGKVYVYEVDSQGNAVLQWTILGENSGDWFGYSTAGVKDIDGDKVNELVVGAPYFDGTVGHNSGKIYAYNSKNGNLKWSKEGTLPSTLNGNQFGFDVSGTPIFE